MCLESGRSPGNYSKHSWLAIHRGQVCMNFQVRCNVRSTNPVMPQLRSHVSKSGLFWQFGLVLPLLSAVSGSTPDAGSIRYNSDVRPILTENCFACHGPDK